MVDGSGGYGRHAATGLVEINPVCVYVRLCNRPDYKLANPPASCEAGNSTAPTVAGCIPGCKQFDHPFVQAQGMFIGEMLCLLAFKIGLLCSAAPRRPADRPDESSYSPFIFALPALCDCLGTSTMYLGLTMTYASVFQMLRGSVVVFTGILSVVFLKRRLRLYHWLGMLLVCTGALVVGSSSLTAPAAEDDSSHPAVLAPSNPFLGNVLIVCAQVIVAVQMVIEEKFLSRYNVHALEAVGWEGVFGMLYISCALVAMYFTPFGPDICDGHACIENSLHALREFSVSPYLVAAVVGNCFSIASFNFFGISVTQSMSATHRMVLDSMRTLIIWIISLKLQWQAFDPLQVVGFAILLAGTLVYNQLVPVQCLTCADSQDWPEAEGGGGGGGGFY
eukprot:Tamp_14927.p1 GENE.Tamp_14927~~Tamp_14927.p1  ORF type:complete len:392 (+),score=75.51 Tamp_14927:266-1441(+)